MLQEFCLFLCHPFLERPWLALADPVQFVTFCEEVFGVAQLQILDGSALAGPKRLLALRQELPAAGFQCSARLVSRSTTGIQVRRAVKVCQSWDPGPETCLRCVGACWGQGHTEQNQEAPHGSGWGVVALLHRFEVNVLEPKWNLPMILLFLCASGVVTKKKHRRHVLVPNLLLLLYWKRIWSFPDRGQLVNHNST